jgi:hypothetical protein
VVVVVVVVEGGTVVVVDDVGAVDENVVVVVDVVVVVGCLVEIVLTGAGLNVNGKYFNTASSWSSRRILYGAYTNAFARTFAVSVAPYFAPRSTDCTFGAAWAIGAMTNEPATIAPVATRPYVRR